MWSPNRKHVDSGIGAQKQVSGLSSRLWDLRSRESRVMPLSGFFGMMKILARNTCIRLPKPAGNRKKDMSVVQCFHLLMLRFENHQHPPTILH